MDSSKLTIISSTKVSPDKLLAIGDRNPDFTPQASSTKSATRCTWCCAIYGTVLSSVTVLPLTAFYTALTIWGEKRIHYSINGACRQAIWLAIPGCMVCGTLHYFASEAMWSQKRNAWGQAWAKAVVVNALMWSTGIAMCTLGWRKVLPLSAWGRRLYYRWPRSAENIDIAVLRSGDDIFSGMGTFYWLCGVASGHMGLLTVISFCSFYDRPYLMMAPHGSYSQRCLPPWRQEHLATLAGIAIADK